MSNDLKDIKESWTNFESQGLVFKIAYDHKTIADVENMFGGKSYQEILQMISLGELNRITDIINFCALGFKKYHKENHYNDDPAILAQILENIENYRVLFDICIDEFYKKVMTPAIYDHISEGAKAVEKKIKDALTTGQGNSISLQKSSDLTRTGFGVPTLASLWRCIIRTVSQKAG